MTFKINVNESIGVLIPLLILEVIRCDAQTSQQSADVSCVESSYSMTDTSTNIPVFSNYVTDLANRQCDIEASRSENSVQVMPIRYETLSDGSIRTISLSKGYIELGSGGSYKDAQGDWHRSLIEPQAGPNGSIEFNKIPWKFSFGHNVNSETVVEGKREGMADVHSAVAGLSYYDLVSGKSVVFAQVKNSIVQPYGEGVYYTNAFDGCDGDILYKVCSWGLEQDVVIFGSLPHPESFGLSPETTYICVLTELVGLDLSSAGVTREEGITPGLPSATPLLIYRDDGQNWNRVYNLQRGFARVEDDALSIGADDCNDSAQAVATRLVQAQGRTFLSEEIPIAEVLSQPSKFIASKRVANATELVLVPKRRPRQSGESQELTDKKTSRHDLSLLDYQPRGSHRFVFDYVNYAGTNQTSLTFRQGQTYFITNTFVMEGATLTIEPGCFVKFAPNGSIRLQNGATIQTKSHSLNPAIFTSAYDTNQAGENIAGYAGDPNTNRYPCALNFQAAVSNTVEGLVIKYAQLGINFSSSSGTQIVQHAQFLNCDRAVEVRAGTNNVYVRDCIVKDSAQGVWANTNGVLVRNSTFDNVSQWAVLATGGVSSLFIQNDLFAALTNNIFRSNATCSVSFGKLARYNSSTNETFGSSIVNLTGNPFQTGALGGYYLAQTNASLVNGGLLPATSWGLYHYTTATNGIKETNSTVDIGSHYANTFDTDGDGLYDVQEDLSGNGSYSTNEVDICSWTNADTDADGLSDGLEFNTYGTHPKLTDTDGDGYDDWWEIYNGSDPLSSTSILFDISGKINYTGTQTGMIRILITSYDPVLEGMKLDYSFNASGSPVWDISGNNYTGNVSGAVWTTSGAEGGAYWFDGVNDHILAGNIGTISNGTISFWMNADTVENHRNPFTTAYAGGDNCIRFEEHTDASFFAGALVITNSAYASAGGIVASNWYNVVFGWDVSNAWGYLNGVYKWTSTASNMNKSFTTVAIGNGYSTSPERYWKGRIDEVRIYQRQLTSSEITNVYLSGGTGQISRIITVSSTGAYTAAHLPSQRSYWVTVFRDVDGDSIRDSWEARGAYASNAIYLAESTTNANVMLVEPDIDGDGYSDWTEIIYGTVATNAASFPATISGTISYTGWQAGAIHVLASASNVTNSVTIPAGGVYAISNLPTLITYTLSAYRDSNTNSANDATEAQGTYSNNPLSVTVSVSNINITLNDADADQDGMPDWWESLYGFNPTSGVYASRIGWWKFDESTGTNVTNSASSSYNGNTAGMASTNWTPGKLGNALSFDGTDDYVRIPQSPAMITGGQFTASAWVYFDASAPDDLPTVVADLSSYCFSAYPGFLLYCDIYAPGANAFMGTCSDFYFIADSNSTTGRWASLAMVYDRTNVILYVDGIRKSSSAAPNFTAAQRTNFYIGWADLPSDFSTHWKGKLDDVRLYKSALSSNAVYQMYDVFQDPDNDGLNNLQEYQQYGSPTNRDTDGDGLVDGSDGLISTNTFPQGVDANANGYVDGEMTYGTNPTNVDTDADGLIDGEDGLVSTNTYLYGVDADHDGFVDGELDAGTDALRFDTDQDGVDDGFERFYGANPTNSLASSGINRNWLFHNNTDYSSATWELVPGLWQRFLMVDYRTGTNSVYFLVPTNAVLDPGGILAAQTRFYDGSVKWTNAYYFTNTIISASNTFHGLPTLGGAYTVKVYRADWVQPTSVIANTTVYYVPHVKSTNVAQFVESYLVSQLLTNQIGATGCGSNNWWFGTQYFATNFFGQDYSFTYSPHRLTNGNFESGAPTSASTLPGWLVLGDGAEISTSITRNASAYSFLVTNIARIYQNIAVHPGEELVISGYMLTPAATNAFDPSPISTDRYGMVSIEYFDIPDGDAAFVDQTFFASTNAQNQWTFFAITSLVPNLAKSANVSLRLELIRAEESGSGNLYFDDVGVTVISDSDTDGMPNWWEANYPSQLATNMPTDSIGDLDGDGLINIREYRNGLSPTNTDSDADGMADKWELDRGLNPQSADDAIMDYDGDGLSNLEEFQYGSNPLLRDSDHDGLDDGTEVFDYETNPALRDFGGFTTIQTIDGSNIVGSLGQWTNSSTDVCAVDRRGYVEYSITAPTGDVYRMEIEGRDQNASPGENMMELRVSLDGVFLERIFLFSTDGSTGTANCFLPWVTAGVHTVRYYWDNVGLEQSLRIRQLRLQSASGSDLNGNGVKDWVDSRVARMSGIDVAPTSSVVSPICLEGRDPYVGMMTISTGVLNNSAGDRWYANVGLFANTSVSVRVTYQSGGLITTNSISWKPTNLLNAHDTLIRKNDSLLLTAYPEGATNGTVGIQIVGLTNYTTTVSSPVSHKFVTGGSYTVIGTYTPVSGSATSAGVRVQAMTGDFTTNPACWTHVTRRWACSNLPAQAVIEYDDRLSLTESISTNGGRLFNLKAIEPEKRYVIARIESGGSILTNACINGFRVAMSSETGAKIADVCNTGDQLIETTIVANPVLDDVTLNGEIIIGGLMFDDGGLTRQWTNSSFDALGQCTVRFIRAASSPASYCHVVNVFQGTEFIAQYEKK